MSWMKYFTLYDIFDMIYPATDKLDYEYMSQCIQFDVKEESNYDYEWLSQCIEL